MVNVTGWIAPAPRPWTARQAMSAAIERAEPQASEPATKSAIPARRTGLRPRRSASFPQIGTVTVVASM